MKKICFISCFFNLVGYKKPLQNCYNYLRCTVGNVFSRDDFFFAQIENGNHLEVKSIVKKGNYLKFKTDSVLWHKERMLNLLVEKFELVDKFEYICWIDTDTWFQKPIKIPENFDKTIFQPFKNSHRAISDRNIDFTQEFVMDGEKWDSFAFNKDGDKGLSWGIHSDYWHELGGLFDYGIVGGGDEYFIKRILGEKVLIGCTDFNKEINIYAENSTLTKKDIGYLDNTIYAMWHGALKNRGYDERIKILRKYDYSPEKHLEVEKSGLYRIKNEDFQKDIKDFFESRKEDS